MEENEKKYDKISKRQNKKSLFLHFIKILFLIVIIPIIFFNIVQNNSLIALIYTGYAVGGWATIRTFEVIIDLLEDISEKIK